MLVEDCTNHYTVLDYANQYIPVVPHKAVAEVSE